MSKFCLSDSNFSHSWKVSGHTLWIPLVERPLSGNTVLLFWVSEIIEMVETEVGENAVQTKPGKDQKHEMYGLLQRKKKKSKGKQIKQVHKDF